MSFIQKLCCIPSRSGRTATPIPSASQNAADHAPATEKTKEDKQRMKPDQGNQEGLSIITELSENRKRPTKDILEPHLQREAELRKAFATGDSTIPKLANLVPLYNGREQELKTRNIDRELNSDDNYIMQLPGEKLRSEQELAIVPTLDDYQRNFRGFTHGILEGLDWQNVVAAGSSALLPLLPHRQDLEIVHDPSEENAFEAYYQQAASSSDIDLFIYGLEEKAAVEKILDIENVIRKNQRLAPDTGLALRTENAITFISPRWPYRHVQIILRLYKSPSEILTGFDVDCACVAYDGQQVYSNPRGVASIATRTNTIDLSRRSPSYESRLFKYRSHNFDAYWDSLDRSQINMVKCTLDAKPKNLKGLARLIFLEFVVAQYGDQRKYHQLRRLKKIQETGSEPTHSGYASHEIPYGQRFTAPRVRQYVVHRSKEPHHFGTASEVVRQGARKGTLRGPVSFLKDDPGRQMIGSFHPLTANDWTDMAYAPEDSESEDDSETE